PGVIAPLVDRGPVLSVFPPDGAPQEPQAPCMPDPTRSFPAACGSCRCCPCCCGHFPDRDPGFVAVAALQRLILGLGGVVLGTGLLVSALVRVHQVLCPPGLQPGPCELALEALGRAGVTGPPELAFQLPH